MLFGNPADFAIEAYHEPSGSSWTGFGRMCIYAKKIRLGHIDENHCSLFHAADRLREAVNEIKILWDESFNGLSDKETFDFLDRVLYLNSERSPESIQADWERFGRFNFLTNTGEQFDDSKTFIACRNGLVHVFYQLRNNKFGSVSFSVKSFHDAIEPFLYWFDTQVVTIAPPFFPIEQSPKQDCND
ncbi:MAG: hypothetical protein ABIP71_15005 [Verrucomicrobiota bacterium]